MRILKLVLHKYTRLRLNLIETITYEPTAPTQFIIGTNGSGKSSLIHECSPVTPSKDDYEKGGYKHIIIDLEGMTYELRSEFNTDGQHHSFIRDGKDLNEGGTVTVQNELVKTYFRYTSDIHALLIGENTFTKMNVSERKRWFTMLANANYDYAVNVFKKVTDKYNECRHALKRTKERSVIESAKLLPFDQLEQLRNECSDMYVKVQKLIEIRQPTITPASQLMQQSIQLTKSLENIAKETRQLIKRTKIDLPRTLQTAQESIVLQRQKIVHLQEQADVYFADFERMQQLWEAMQASHLENAAQIQQEINTCEEIITKATHSLVYKQTVIINPSTTIASCDKLLAWWPSIKHTLHDNREKNWGREKMKLLNEEIDGITVNLEKAKSLKDRSLQTIEHHEQHSAEQSVNCPKCQHRFQPNFSPMVLEDAKRRFREMNTTADTLGSELTERLELRSLMQTYFNDYSNVLQQIRNSPGMETFLKWISDENTLLYNPSMFTMQLQRYRDDAGKWLAIECANTRIDQARVLAKQLEERNALSGGEGVHAEHTRLEKLVGECEHNKQVANARLQMLIQQLQGLEQLNTHQVRLQDGVNKIESLHCQAADSLRRELFAQMLRELQSALAFKEQALMAAERQQSVLENIEQEITHLSEATADLKILQQELSPTEGLIGEGIHGFMRTFIDQMNKTIESVFSYPLKVMPCSVDSDGSVNLTYKFPIKVNGENRSDIVKGSSGMKEVIDLSFKVAAMKSLGLGAYPMFLDEFGRTLDPLHRQASVLMLTSMMELERFEQVYFISHDVTMYSSMGRSEILVLHDANIVLPPNTAVNTNVTIA